ncbi:MAG: antitoxin Xre/MbcA/ParS toxin-binding domain-containing protein [Planctomycetota bacterium]
MATTKAKAKPASRSHLGSSLGYRPTSVPKLIEKVEQGIEVAKLERLRQKLSIPMVEMARLLSIPPRTLDRRMDAGRLTSLESDRLLRLARVFEAAVDLYEDERAAAEWLQEPARALNFERPLDVARSDVGAREVECLIGRIGHGVFT